MRTLVIDIGGTNVKIWRPGDAEKIKIASGPTLGPKQLLEQVNERLQGTTFERVSIGYPGEVAHGHPIKDPYNLASGWTDFDFADAFQRPVRLMNDACMQALGSYAGGRMLYLGLGTGIGSTFMNDGRIVPLAIGHLQFSKADTFDSAMNRRALKKNGVRRWGAAVGQATVALKKALLAEYVVLGGGNAKKLNALPPGCRRGGNYNAYLGGLRMWEDAKWAEPIVFQEPPLLRVNAAST